MRAYPLTSEELVDDLASQVDEVTATVRKRFGALSRSLLAEARGLDLARAERVLAEEGFAL